MSKVRKPLQIYLTNEQRAQIERCAKIYGESLSTYMRRIALERALDANGNYIEKNKNDNRND